MDRRDTVLALLALAAAAGAPPGAAQSAKPPRRIAMLDDSVEGSRARGWAAFRARLRELGYVEGMSFVIDARWAGAQVERLPALVAELIALKPDVIVTAGTPSALAARKATSSIPIVFTGAADPIKAGLVMNLARPEGNLTGISSVAENVAGKWLELLREITPRAKSIALLTHTENPVAKQIARELQEKAKPLGLTVRVLDGRNRSNVDLAFDTMARERVNALIVTATGVLLEQRRRIVEAAARLGIPAVYGRREYPEEGGLMSYGADPNVLFRRAADYVHRILQGAKPSDLPFEMASVFALVVNAKAMQALGLKIPESVRVRVDEIIQ